MSQSAETFDQIVKARRSVRIFDAKHSFDHESVSRSLERAILAPNSNNLQLWEFYRVNSDSAKEQLAGLCFNQPAARTANEMVAIVTRVDLWRDRVQSMIDHLKREGGNSLTEKQKGAINYYQNAVSDRYHKALTELKGLTQMEFDNGSEEVISREVTETDIRISAHRSAALAAQTFMLSMKAEGYDSCPMEGFDSLRVKEFLQLPERAEINMIVGVGKGTEEGVYGERFRIHKSKVIFEL